MELYTTEEEQVEKIKKWIREYGPTIVISLIVVLLATFGWRYWQGHEETLRATASIKYEQLLASSMGNDKDATRLQAQQLIKTYSATPYAKLAALLLAKEAVANKQYPQALKQLQWVMHNADSKAIKQIARNRAARVYIADNKAKEALTLLTTIDDASYKPIIESIRGDAYVALNDEAMARKAYQQALNALPKEASSWPLLQMKLNNIATNHNEEKSQS